MSSHLYQSSLREDINVASVDPDIAEIRKAASRNAFTPPGAMRCKGPPIFRSQLARDLGALLDLDDDVESWGCLPADLDFHDRDGVIVREVPDFCVRYLDGSEMFLDAGWRGLKIADPNQGWTFVPEDEIHIEPALSNAQDMLRYARLVVPLGDRVRLLAHLEDVGSATLIEAASGMRESIEPVGTVIALVLQRVLKIDWRERRLGPDARVEAVR